MEITEEQYQRIAHCLPVQRGSVCTGPVRGTKPAGWRWRRGSARWCRRSGTGLNPWEYDRELYRKRNEVERLFRRVFTRYDKLDALFPGFIHFALIADASR